MINDRRRRQEYAWFVLITILAIGFAYGLFFFGHQGVYYDSIGYAELGRAIAEKGIWNFSDHTRTYGYPLFVALLWFFTDGSASTLRFVIFIAQLAIFLSVCLYVAHSIRALKGPRFSLALYACTVLNPLLLIYTTVILTDLLSAVLIYLSVFLSAQARFPPQDLQSTPASLNDSRHQRVARYAFFSFLLASVTVMIRPANVSIIVAVALIWVMGEIIFKNRRGWLFAAIMGLIIPFIPQLISNYRAFSQIHPLITYPLYSYQMDVGIQALKYATLALPGYPNSIIYSNPFLPPNISSSIQFVTQQPLGYLLTISAHVFALFDHDFPFPYIVDLQPWYRWYLSVANYLFLFIAGIGVLLWLGQLVKQRRFDQSAHLFGSMLVTALVYIPIFIPVAVESRFSLPEYLLLSPFLMFGVSHIRKAYLDRNWGHLGKITFWGGLFLGLCISLSFWIQQQASIFNISDSVPKQEIAGSLKTRFGDRIQILGFALKLPQTPQGGEPLWLTLDWQCAGVVTDHYDIQVDLLDSQDRVWASGLRYGDAPVSPCPSRFWEPHRETGDVLTFKTSPAMPAGMYRVTVSLYDRKDDRFLPVTDPSGHIGESTATITTIFIAKNQKSFTANQLNIEQPFFVDMEEIRFLGYAPLPQTVRPGQKLDVKIYWRARGKPQGDYLVAIQFRAIDGQIVFEQTSRPANNTSSTLSWNVGEVLLDWHALTLPTDLATGSYQVFVALRDSLTQRVLGQVALPPVQVIQ